jgi:hypothetical protein
VVVVMGFPFLDWLAGVFTPNEFTRSSRKREKRSGFKYSSIKAESAQASTQPRIEADRKLGAFAQVWRQPFRCFDAINAVEYRALNMKASILAFQIFSPQ